MKDCSSSKMKPKRTRKPPALQEVDLYTFYPDCIHLRFLLDIFEALGVTPQDYGKLTDNPASTGQSLRQQLHHDDMKVSKAKAIVSAFGYRLEIELSDPEVEPQALPYVLVLPKSLQEKRSALLDRKTAKYSNLNFVWRFMLQHKISKRGLAIKLGLSSGAVFTWFNSDDIMISHVYAIAKAYGVDVVFTVSEL